jgi:sugar-specific transcriptional regulator TrmB
MTEQLLVNAVLELGLSKDCGQIYSNLVLNPNLSVSELAKILQTNRVKIYELLQKMQEEELLEYEKNYTRGIKAIAPNLLLAKVKSKHIQTGRLVSDLADSMPMFLSKYFQNNRDLSIKIYDGDDKFIDLFDRFFNEAKDEILFLSNASTLHSAIGLENIAWNAQKRAKKKVRIRIITSPVEAQKHQMFSSEEYLRKVKMLNYHPPFKGSIIMSGSNLTLWNPLLPRAVWISDPVIAETFKFMFDCLWGSIE